MAAFPSFFGGLRMRIPDDSHFSGFFNHLNHLCFRRCWTAPAGCGAEGWLCQCRKTAKKMIFLSNWEAGLPELDEGNRIHNICWQKHMIFFESPWSRNTVRCWKTASDPLKKSTEADSFSRRCPSPYTSARSFGCGGNLGAPGWKPSHQPEGKE